MTTSEVFLLPGWKNSGPDHWQSRWAAEYGYARVEQHDWMHPLRGDWAARLEEVLLENAVAGSATGSDGAVLVAHGLGCLLVAAWAAHSRNTHRVRDGGREGNPLQWDSRHARLLLMIALDVFNAAQQTAQMILVKI